jgi:nicotinamide-nucleotide amidase
VTVNVEVICIGNELLIGKIENTNASWLAKQITALGANLTRVTVIQDIIPEIAKTINEVIARKPQFIITTGGLGPTFDDKTLQGVAAALNRKLTVNPVALEFVKRRITEYLKKRGYPLELELTPPRLKMATFPEGTEVVNNPAGTAPALRVEIEDTVLFTLPGIPSEMEAIFNETIAPQIKHAVGACIFCQRSVFVENVFESNLAPLIDIVMENNPGVYVKSHPLKSDNKPGIELHLTIIDNKNSDPTAKVEKAAKEIIQLIAQSGGSAKQRA